MKRLILDTWSHNYYQEQENGKWRCMGQSPQTKPIDTIEYTILATSLNKGTRYYKVQNEVTSNKLLLIL